MQEASEEEEKEKSNDKEEWIFQKETGMASMAWSLQFASSGEASFYTKFYVFVYGVFRWVFLSSVSFELFLSTLSPECWILALFSPYSLPLFWPIQLSKSKCFSDSFRLTCARRSPNRCFVFDNFSPKWEEIFHRFVYDVLHNHGFVHQCQLFRWSPDSKRG